MKGKGGAGGGAPATRQSLNCGRRVFITKPDMPEGRALAISAFTMSPLTTPGKL